MRIELDAPPDGRVCIVVDVLRASSTVVTMLGRGCQRVVVAADIEEARALHRRLTDHLLCGEEGGFPPPGFDHGNSPVEFSRLDLAGDSAILVTTNGTRTLARVADQAAVVLVGCLLNRGAVAAAAVRLAGQLGAGVAVVSAGQSGSPAEDAAAGRAIIEAAEGREAPGFDAAWEVGASAHAADLRRLGLAADVDYCTQTDASNVVPVLIREDGLLVLRAL